MDAKLRKDYVDGLEPPEKKVTDLPNLAKETIVEFQELFARLGRDLTFKK